MKLELPGCAITFQKKIAEFEADDSSKSEWKSGDKQVVTHINARENQRQGDVLLDHSDSIARDLKWFNTLDVLIPLECPTAAPVRPSPQEQVPLIKQQRPSPQQ